MNWRQEASLDAMITGGRGGSGPWQFMARSGDKCWCCGQPGRRITRADGAWTAFFRCEGCECGWYGGAARLSC